MPQQTRIFRVFVSSTFSDMKTERNLLREEVFPVLEQFCRENGARFQAIDLRWGVSEESQRDQKTMEICLNEIRRCQQLSPRPNFLILLGDRYGWQPVPASIPKMEMDQIITNLDSESQKLLKDWYKLDENAVPPEYVLQPWGERVKEYHDWEPVENRLRLMLRKTAQKAGLSEDELVKYKTSATHQEILAGVFTPPPDVTAPESHVLAFFRTLPGPTPDEQANDYLDIIDGKADPYSKSQLDKLRENLKAKLKDNYISYTADCTKDGIALKDPQQFINQTIDHLKTVIESEMAEIMDEDEIMQEKRYHEEFAKRLITYFTGRIDTLDHIRSYLDNNNTQKVLSLIGASGTGKTCIMAKAGLDAQQRNAVVVSRFIGANASSSNIISLLTGLCGQIAQEYSTELDSLLEEEQKGKHLDIHALTALLPKCLKLATPEMPLIIFLDALDQLSDTDGAKSLNWLIRELPSHVGIVVSCLPGLGNNLENTDIYHLPPMPKADGERLLTTWLNARKRKLTDPQKEEVLSKFSPNGLPLFLKICFEEARTWTSYDKPESLPDNVPTIIERFLSGLEKAHSPILVSRVVGYLLSGKYKGLTEDEILDMLVFDKENPADYWQYFLSHSHSAHRAKVEKAGKLPDVVWSRLFLDLAPYLTERDSHGERLIGFYHRQFNEILKKKYLGDPKSVHIKLSKYFAESPHFFDGDEQKQPNVRKCVELPWQQTKGELWDEVTDNLCDLLFIQAKCAAKLTYELIEDYNFTLEYLPEAQEKRQEEKKRQERMAKYTEDLIAYAKGEIETLDIPQSVKIWSKRKTRKELRRIINKPNRHDSLNVFHNFLGTEAYTLHKYAPENPNFVVQRAWNHSNRGPIGKAAEIIPIKNKEKLLLRAQQNRQKYNPLPQILKKLIGHTDYVSAVSVTPDGKRAVSGSGDKTLIVWNLESGEKLKTLEGHTKMIKSVSMTPDGKRAVSGSYDKTLIVWNLESGEKLKTLEGHTKMIKSVSMTPDGKRAVSGSDDKTLIVWDLESGEKLKTLEGHTKMINSVSMTPDGKRAMSGSSDETIIVWDLESMKALKTLEGYTSKVGDVSVTPDGNRLISLSDWSCILWNLERKKPIKTIAIPTRKSYDVSITPDGKRLLSGSMDGKIIVWDLERGKKLKTLEGHTDDVSAVSVTPDGKRAVSGSGDKTLIVWDLQSGVKFKTDETLVGHTDRIYTMSVIPDGKRAVSADSGDKTLILWDLERGEKLKTLKGHKDEIYAMSVTPDGKCAVSGSGDKTLIVWDLESGKKLKTFEGHKDRVHSMSVTPDGKHLVYLTSRCVWVLNLNRGNKTKSFEAWSMLALTPDGKHTVTFSYDETAYEETALIKDAYILLDLESGKQLKILKGYTEEISNLTISPDGKRAVAAGCFKDHCVVWDLKSGESKILRGHTDFVNTVNITPDGKRAVSGSSDHTLIVWDLESGVQLKTLKGHEDEVRIVRITQDGKRIISGSEDKTIIVWDLESGDKIAQLILTSSIKTFVSCHQVVFIVTESGEYFILHASEDLLNPDIFLVNACQIWDFESKKYMPITADCPYCGQRFEPDKRYINTINSILRDNHIGPEDSPCLKLPDEAWEVPSLLSECPKCKEKIRFNPFIAGGE